MTEHSLTAIGVVLDCAEPVALADFWQEAIGFTARNGDGDPYVVLSASPLRRPLNHLTLQKVPEPRVGKNRCHFDLFARNPASEIERLVELGATITTSLPDNDDNDLIFAQMADPEGNEFCVVASPSKG